MGKPRPEAVKLCVPPIEVAALLSIGYDAALDLFHSGALPNVQLPGRRGYLADVADLRRLIDARKSGAVPGAEPIQAVPEVPENAAPTKRRRRPAKVVAIGRNSSWMQRYTGDDE